MYPPRFEYYSPSTVEETISILGRFDGEAKIVAGGQSLTLLIHETPGRCAGGRPR